MDAQVHHGALWEVDKPAATYHRPVSTRSGPDPGVPPVTTITSAPEPLGVDQARRQRRYLVQMGIRLVCFLGAVVLWSHVPLAVSLVLVVGAVVLPYVAVLGANAGRERQDRPGDALVHPEIEAGPERPGLDR